MVAVEAGMDITPTVRLVRPLGAGGMGAVWVADHLTLHTQVVVKFMSVELAKDPANVARFSKEASAAAAVKSPHVVQTFDHGVAPNGAPFIVMELLEGEDLGKRIERAGPLALGEVAEVIAQASKALGRAHAAGIVHRDIKPDNIFLCHAEEGEVFVKILDFGIAKMRDSTGGLGATRTGALMGTPYYMSPEQALGLKGIDLRTDLWSLGVVAFEAMTGVRPFDGDTIGALAVAIAHGPMPVPSSASAPLGPAIDAWFARACARDLTARFSTAKELSEAFQVAVRAGAGTGSHVSPTAKTVSAPELAASARASSPNGGPRLSTTTSPTSDPSGPEDAQLPGIASRSTTRRAVAAVVAASVVVGGLAAVLFARSRGSSGGAVGLVEPPVTPSASSGTGAAPVEAASKNRWVRIEAHAEGVLGVATEKTSDLGFRPSRRIKPPPASYEIQQHEVTWEELDAFTSTRPDAKPTVPAWVPQDGELRKKYPATGVSWTTALEYCKAEGGSLPTEEQWEFAARGKDLRPNPWGSEPLDLARTVAFRGKKAALQPAMSSDQDQTPGSLETVLYDLAGNALEWTLDLYRDDRPGQNEGWVQEGGLTFRAVRGLPVADPIPKSIPQTGAAYRQALCATGPCPTDPVNTLQWVGFRCARRVH